MSYEEPSVSILLDSTRSMELFDELDIEDEETASHLTGNSTALGDALLSLIQSKGNVVLYTDGNNNAGRSFLDVAALAARLDATLYAVSPSLTTNEIWVRVEGPDEVPLGSLGATDIVVGKLGGDAAYNLMVFVDDSEVLTRVITQSEAEDKITLRHRFDTPGDHMIRAVITPSTPDYFQDNNVFYKTVRVLPKPRVLFISDKPSPLPEALKDGYELQAVRGNYSDYDAVIINDMPLSALSEEEIGLLGDYLRDGGGLVVLGGQDSYDLGGYRGSLFEAYLPVRAGKSRFTGEDLGLVIAIDISGSTGHLFGNYTKIDVSKAVAVGLIRTLRKDHSFGVIAFDDKSYVIANLSRAHDRMELEEKIARLQFAGGTIILSAQTKADEMLRSFPGRKYVIIITDGNTNLPQSSLEKANAMAGGGVKTYTVGVGYDANSDFLDSLAEQGQGLYFPQGEEGRLKLIFGEPEEEEIFSLRLLDTNHFITRGQEVFGSITGLNDVTPKDSARTLVTTGSGEPLLAVWRFGLGRVASLATDDGEVWGSQLYMGSNSRVFTRTLNWAIGPRSDGFIMAADTEIGNAVEVLTTADLDLSIDGTPLLFENRGPGEYRASHLPERKGFYTIEGNGIQKTVAVNYPRELAQLGVSPDLKAVVEATGGRILEPEGFEEAVQKEAIDRTRKMSYEKEDISLPFILAAMLLFFSEVAYRRYQIVKEK